ncbi:hypothetical protein A8C75_01095 [Marinobacterium aestuarii]|uniref:Uncharacterized protein n=1 Tax=Marinobacterium aestuarii TaxID=1821621 RepID=A0A1A9EUE1_9GAMM|nr:hypothetical protein [Marinobacterium aestuarii]ANG61189.1 hypothetical protein A8C75_01095 [Marinobacterium aestuarii]
MSPATSIWQRLLARWRPDRCRSLIMLGIDSGCHRWHGALSEGSAFRIRVFIDDEPWNHRTRIGDAPVHYPSELLALLQKHRACALLQVEDNARPAIDATMLDEIARLKIPLLTLPAQLPRDPAAVLRQMLTSRAPER